MGASSGAYEVDLDQSNQVGETCDSTRGRPNRDEILSESWSARGVTLPFEQLRKGLRRLGLEVSRYAGTANSRRQRVLQNSEVSVVLDVGANIGQYGKLLRTHGYDRRIVSFEPLPAALKELTEVCADDPLWEAVGLAIGDRDEARVFHVSGNSQSSSFKPMLERHISAAPSSAYVADVTVNMRRLDSVVHDYINEADVILVKLDVQGYEEEVLDGSNKTLAGVDIVEMEMSLVPLYKGQRLMHSMVEKMQQLGFELIGLERGYEDPRSGHLLQVDGMFRRKAGLLRGTR